VSIKNKNKNKGQRKAVAWLTWGFGLGLEAWSRWSLQVAVAVTGCWLMAAGYTASGIAHLAETETPFGFLASTFLPITTQTPKHLGFGVFMPSKLRRDTPFGLKTKKKRLRHGHGEMTFPTTQLFGLGYPANGFFFLWSYFSAV
jgi:hypothetical protein